MDRDLSSLLELLRFPSISTDSTHKSDVEACADWIVARFRSAGLDVAKYPTKGHPIVLAKNAHKPGRPTVLIYGHYDVQPVDPIDLWTHPPFEPHIENGYIFARGSTDNKGQFLAHIIGVERSLAGSGLPVNLTFLIEGEEEIGSRNLGPFLREHQKELACDVIAVSDTGMVAPGVPTFTYGLRGIACLEVELHGPSMDLHSGIYGGTVANPATMIAHLVASMHDLETGRVAVADFYDKVAPLESWEREAWANLPIGGESLAKLTGVPSLFGEQDFSALERIWARPTAEINGIGGGYQGEGSKTVIPSKAMAKFSFRLVPHQNPEEILELAARHLRKHCPPGVRLEIHLGHSGMPYRVDPHDRYGKAAQAALEKTFGRKPALIREGGSIPIIQTFKDVLGVDTLLLGLALPDCRAHAPDENFLIENFTAGIQMNQNLLAALAEA